jgi:hypothetical protein
MTKKIYYYFKLKAETKQDKTNIQNIRAIMLEFA